MTADHPDVIRSDVLRSLGADRETVEELSTYCENPFPVDALPQPPALPLPEEAHTTDWRDYLDEQGDDPFGFLQSRLVQLNIPIQEGVSKTAAYADVVRRGKPFDESAFGGRLTLKQPELFRVSVHEHPAGALPVLLTPNRSDFETVVQALAFRCEATTIGPAVNAQIGYVGWPAEMKRVTSSEKWRFLDRLIVVTDSPYSSVSAAELGLEWDAATWREKSAALRMEHEFTHYATKRLYGKMTLNVLDEIIADWAGMSSAMGDFRSAWFVRFLGLDDLPKAREDGRIHTYRQTLSDEAFRILAPLTLQAAEGLEALHQAHYTREQRPRFLLALTRLTLELLAADNRERFFGEAYGWAARMLDRRTRLHTGPESAPPSQPFSA
jgi:hypothetical protein